MSRTALVTGGNRGLGLETCRQLARAGFAVILTSRAPDGEKAAVKLKAEGMAVDYRPLDVARAESVKALAAALERDGVKLDLLVNNAGIALGGVDANKARATLEVNFFGPLQLTEALLGRLNEGANVVMVSSGMGELTCVSPELRARLTDPAMKKEQLVELMRSFAAEAGNGGWVKAGWPSSAYRASKVGLNALTRVFARDLADRKIRVNAVCPGWVRTEMGGPGATRSVEEGARSIVATALDAAANGGFFRDGQAIAW